MAKSFRVRTDVRTSGAKDKNITFELNQDFDLLEILSLSLTQQDVYTRMCADFGVVVGRVTTNAGFGIPNAKVSIFIPLDDADEKNEVIKFLYPYKQPFDTDEDGRRYNLLSSEKTFDCHVNVGTFPTLNNVLNNQEVKYVYDKYYKYTVKTNEAGDFMIYGVPVGDQTIIMDVDVSDIGCFSLLPEDFKIKGYPESDFDGPRFKDDRTIDSLPQIINLQKSIDVRPFWGDEEFCRAAITRVDFDLSATGFKLEPTAVFMGSTATDTGKDSVNNNCRPKAHMGDLCSLITKPGIIDCIRYTPFFENDPNAYPDWAPGGWNPSGGGEVPVLERYYLEDGGRVIDNTGAFLVHMPMNLDYMITNEFGDMVLSEDPTKGVPTRTRCRFRVRAEQATGSARLRRRASYLVPNIREYYKHWEGNDNGDWPGIEASSYAFSIHYSDYHPWAQKNMIPAAKDVFYDMTFNRVYTFSQFHDHIKHGGRRQFIGVKEILPSADEQCSTTAMFFPINSAVRSPNLITFLWMFLIDFLGMIYMMITVMLSLMFIFLGIILYVVMFIIWVMCFMWCLIYCIHITIWGFTLFRMSTLLGPGAAPPTICGEISLSGHKCGADCQMFGIRLGFILFKLRQTKYPECEKCMCRTNIGTIEPNTNPPTYWEDSFAYLVTKWPCPDPNPNNPAITQTGGGGSPCGIPQCPPGQAQTNSMGGKYEHDCCGESDDVRVCCPDHYGFNSDVGINPQSTSVNDGIAGGGCYVKLFCMNGLLCYSNNMNLTVLVEWTRREKIAVGLCNGIMNYFWENNWVNGFLYMFQFKAKLQFDETSSQYPEGTYVTDSRWCKKLTYLHPTEHTFYYRSTPFLITGPNLANGNFIGDTDGVYNPWWKPFAGSSGSHHADGDMYRHILFPTTMVDMGSRNQCIQQICLDPQFSTDCSVTDQIGSTTFQDITNLVSDIYNLKMMFPKATMSTFFPRPEHEIGGDVAQAIMQNCMLGVFGYEANMRNTGCECSITNGVYDGFSLPVVSTGATGGLEYPEPNFTAGTYVQYALNVPDLGNNGHQHNIIWEPHLFTGQTQTIMDGQNLINCLTLDLSQSTQSVPFYPWRFSPSSGNGGMGGHYNDWMGTRGCYKFKWSAAVIMGTTIPPMASNVQCNIFGVPSAPPYIYDGLYQNNMFGQPWAWSSFDNGPYLHPGNYPVLTPDSTDPINFSQPLFYYFGLRPGETSYNIFLRKYVDEELADTVI